jgi:DNA-binding MarR family transcriptional regulator
VTTAITPPGPTTGHRLFVALMGVGRRLKSRPIDGRVDPASLFVLHQVAANAPVRLTELARCMALDPSTVSRHVRQLETSGYLARTGDPDDRRAARLRLTDQGQAVMDEAMRARIAILDQAVAGWSDADLDTLTTLMTRLAAALDRQADETEIR